MKHPIQPLSKDKHGTLRFKRNEIVHYLLEFGQQHGIGLNELATMKFSKEDWTQFAQLIGYSLSGYGDLSYVDDTTWHTAERMAATGKSETEARIEYLEGELTALRDQLRQPMARLFGVHPDDLKRNS